MTNTIAWTVERGRDWTLVAERGFATPECVAALVSAFARHGPGAVVVAKRVARAGGLLAMGEFVVHPKGLHSLGRGAPASACRFPEEVDGSLRGAAIFPNLVASELSDPHDPLGLLTWCLEARLRGARVIAVPEAIVLADDAPAALSAHDVDHFRERFGFHPFAPDIDAIAARGDLAPLRWNVRFFGTNQPFEKYAERGAFHWDAYAEHEPFRQRADLLVKLAAQASAHGFGDVLDIGCGDGLYAAHLAELGRSVLGVDDDAAAIRIANERATRTNARFLRGSVYALPVADGAARGAILFDVIEHLHNPARMIRELARVIAPGGALMISTPEWQFGASSDSTYHAFEFTVEELQRVMIAEGFFRVESAGKIGGAYRDIVLTLRRC